jgi:hypothetical protein
MTSKKRVLFFYFFLALSFLIFLASCENSRQQQNSSTGESIHKKQALESQPHGEETSVDLVRQESPEKETSLPAPSLDKMEAQVKGIPEKGDTVNAIVVSDVSPRDTPPTRNVDEGETKSVSRFPENFRDYEPEDITEYPDKTPKHSTQNPETPVTNTGQK